MNKWFASARDLSDSESSDSSEDEKKPVQQTQQAAVKKTGGVAPRKNYRKGYEESSESEDEQRVVKTQKDKKTEAINAVIKDINNHLKINDFSSLMTDFENFTNELQKDQDSGQGIIYEKAGKEGELPLQYLRILIKIEDAINDTTEAVKNKKVNLNKTNSVSLNKLKQKMKKYLPATGPQGNTLEEQMAKFRENPVWSEDERKAAKAEKKKQEEEKAPAKQAAKKKKDSDEESEEESEEEEESEYDDEDEEEDQNGESSESSEDEIDIFKVPREQLTPAQRRLKWVKKDRLPLHMQQLLNQKQTSKAQEKKEQRAQERAEAQQKAEQMNAAITGEKEAKETVLNLKTDYQSIDFTKLDNVAKKIKELQDERMKGRFDPRYHCNVYTFMLNQVKDNRIKVELTINLINALFDTAKVSQQGYMGRDTWLITFDHLKGLLTLLDTQQLKDSLKSFLQREQANGTQSEDGQAEDTSISTSIDIEKSILPGLANFMEKLDHELLKAFQNIGHTRMEYLQRLRDDNKFLSLCDEVMKFLSDNNDLSKASRVAILKLDHLYYKSDSLYERIRKANVQGDDNHPYIPNGESQQVINDLVTLIQRHGTPKMRLRAVLYQVYHHSIHNRYHQAKDLLLKTHIGDIIHLQDIGSQIIYNRAITQVGMSAFRAGLIDESHEILVDICQTAKLREVLAQGISRTPDKPIELEKEEMKRQVPFHMHINLHLLDCIYLISAMLLEIPNIAENQFSVNKRVISKNFKKLIDAYDSKAFQLAAENYRDNLVLAAKQLNKSIWKEAVDTIFSIKLIQKMPEFMNPDSKFKDTLVFKFKEAALKAFLCRGGRTYQSFSVDSLSKQFELPETKLNQIVSKMIIKNKIQAHFDTSSKLLVLDNQSNEVKELQQLSAQYVDKLEMMVENNERLIDMIAGGNLYSHKERTAGEISAINANKRQKQIMKAEGSGVPNTSQQNTNMIMQNLGQRAQR